MNLLDIFEENQKRMEEEKQQDEERAFNKEIREIKSEIILGKKEHQSDSKELLDKLGIKYKKYKNLYYYCGTSSIKKYDYYFEYNKTNVKKIQKYLDQEV